MENDWDIAIIGGGPAGLSAGLYAARGGARTVLFEELFPGGQATKTHLIENYPGFEDGVEGFDLAGKLEKQAVRFGLALEYAAVEALSLAGNPKRLKAGDRELTAKAVILAMGATPRKLQVAREEELTGAGVSYCATCDGALFRGKPVAVVGGGDTAVSDALYLARFCERVYVVHRRDALRAARVLQDAAFAEKKIEFVWDSVLTGLEGEQALSGIAVSNKKTGETRVLTVSAVFAAVGIEPRTALVTEALSLQAGAAIPVDARMETSIPGVFAAGDARVTPLRQVVTACADGAVAATSALEALAGL